MSLLITFITSYNSYNSILINGLSNSYGGFIFTPNLKLAELGDSYNNIIKTLNTYFGN